MLPMFPDNCKFRHIFPTKLFICMRVYDYLCFLEPSSMAHTQQQFSHLIITARARQRYICMYVYLMG